MLRSMPIHYHVPGQVRAWSAAVAMLLLVLPGCDWPNANSDPEHNYRDRVGSVLGVTAPDRAALGSVFDVTIRTGYADGCWQRGHDRVQVLAPLLVRITPYDRQSLSEVCPENAPTFEHVVPVTASKAGPLRIEVLRLLRSVSGRDSIGVIEKFVTVY